MNERISKLAELTLSGKMYPEAQRPNYDRRDFFLSDDSRNAKRIYEYITAQKPVLTPYSRMTGLLVFDGSVPGDAMTVSGLENIGKTLLAHFYCKPIDNISTFEWQHATADYNRIIRRGISGLLCDIEASKKAHSGNERAIDFLNALKTTAEAMLEWAKKCSDESRKLAETVDNPEYKRNLLALSEALTQVPEKPAESFYEAVLSVYILFSFDPDSLGTLDRTLADFYENDLADGKITRDTAKEYLQELFLMLQAKTPVTSCNFTRGGESHFCVGGYLPNGDDGFSDLSMLIIEAMTELPTYIPQISLRWTKKLPHEIFEKVMDFERKDPNKRIAFINDEVKIAGFEEICDIPFEKACGYTSVGCNECAFPGGMVAGTTNANILRCMENTFFERTYDILKAESFDEFFAVYKEELCRDLDEIFDYDDHFNLIRAKDTSYVTSLTFKSCIDKAEPFSHGTAELALVSVGFIGITNAIDSLAIVKQFVFDEKRINMQTLVSALQNDWQGYDDLLCEIKSRGKFFGNDDETSNLAAELFFNAVYEHLKPKRNIFGYPLSIGNLQGYVPHHEMFGSRTKATPDGRHSGEMLKFGIGQSGGCDREGLTALLSSVAKCDKHHIMTGASVTNVYLDEKLVKNDASFKKLTKLFEAYFLMGGSHFQLNYVSKEDLKRAKITPDEYRSLRVRVSGFSDYFVNLPCSVQDDVIARTELDK